MLFAKADKAVKRRVCFVHCLLPPVFKHVCLPTLPARLSIARLFRNSGLLHTLGTMLRFAVLPSSSNNLAWLP